ncbi:MAG TPA: glycosyltransferase [Solirubrobacteraceae bacterium]|nr:glycosyltransferase [Solirubrobacteraceae bacterium]
MSRVLLVHQPVDGGVGRHVRDLADGLAERGHEVVVCGPARPHGISEAVAHRPLDLTRSVDPKRDPAAVARLAGIVGELRPDIVHTHSSKAGAVARLARAAHPHTPVLYSPHLYAFAGDFERPGERRMYRLVERALAPLASRVICVCEDEARLARTIGPSERVRVVYNGVPNVGDGPVDPHGAAPAEQGDQLLGALALLSRRKGIETLIEALPAVLDRHPHLQVAIAGEGPQLPELCERSRRLGLADAVSFVGTAEDPIAFLRGLDVFVLPSWAESFPYVVLEAMSLGLPVVASEVGGVGEALDTDSGVLVPPHNAGTLARALIELLGDNERCVHMGERARERQRRLFDLDGMVERIEAVYDELTSK